MARGRKRKIGVARTESGRIKRNNYAEPVYDHGSDWVRERRARFSVHYNTALGRAYAGKLLGDDADDRYQGGKKFARVYQRMFGGETYRSPLDQTPRGHDLIDDRDYSRDRDWMFAAMDALDVAGVRPFLDQLITRMHTDHGPPWLDRLLSGGKDPCDKMLLDAACKALDIVAPPKMTARILAVTP